MIIIIIKNRTSDVVSNEKLRSGLKRLCTHKHPPSHRRVERCELQTDVRPNRSLTRSDTRPPLPPPLTHTRTPPPHL